MLTDSRKIARRLRAEGWTLLRVRGSHHIFRNPKTGATLVLPHPEKDLPIGTVRSLYKDAGWPRD